MRTIKPLGKIVATQLIKDNKTKGGLVLPDNHTLEQGYRVVAVGEEVTRVKVDDFVAFRAPNAAVIKYEDLPETVLVPEEDVIAIIEKD